MVNLKKVTPLKNFSPNPAPEVLSPTKTAQFLHGVTKEHRVEHRLFEQLRTTQLNMVSDSLKNILEKINTPDYSRFLDPYLQASQTALAAVNNAAFLKACTDATLHSIPGSDALQQNINSFLQTQVLSINPNMASIEASSRLLQNTLLTSRQLNPFLLPKPSLSANSTIASIEASSRLIRNTMLNSFRLDPHLYGKLVRMHIYRCFMTKTSIATLSRPVKQKMLLGIPPNLLRERALQLETMGRFGIPLCGLLPKKVVDVVTDTDVATAEQWHLYKKHRTNILENCRVELSKLVVKDTELVFYKKILEQALFTYSKKLYEISEASTACATGGLARLAVNTTRSILRPKSKPHKGSGEFTALRKELDAKDTSHIILGMSVITPQVVSVYAARSTFYALASLEVPSNDVLLHKHHRHSVAHMDLINAHYDKESAFHVLSVAISAYLALVAILEF